MLMLVIAACSSDSNEDADSSSNASEMDEGTPQQGGEINIGYITDASNYDPILGSAGDDHALLWPIYDTLIAFDADLLPEPGLAESWEFTDDTTLELKLREGVTFHDGTTFDAEAVKFNIERSKSDKSTYSSDFAVIEEVEVVDPTTVILHLNEPDSSLVLALSDRGGMMVSPTAVEEYGEDFSQNPIGAGPFKRVEHVPNGEVVYEAFEDYWQDGMPYLDKMTVKIMGDENTRVNALKSGEIDVAEFLSVGNVQGFENDSSMNLVENLPIRFRTIFLNTSMAPLDNTNVRLAIQHGINRQAIVDGIYFGKGKVANQFLPNDYWAANPDLEIEYNPEKAKQLLEESGLEDVSFTLIHFPLAQELRVVEVMRSQLEEIGIEVELEQMEITKGTSSFFAEKTAHATYSAWPGRPDPQSMYKALLTADSYQNPGNYSTPEIETLIEEAATVYDREDRVELHNEAIEMAILEEAMAIPILIESVNTAMASKVKGYEPNMMAKPIFSTLWVEEE